MEEESVNWAWRRIDENNYRLNSSLAVTQDWATKRWYVVRDGKWALADYPDAGAAITAAESQEKPR